MLGKNRNKIIISIAFVALIIGCVFCILSYINNNSENEKKTEYLSVSRNYNYSGIEEMAGDSDLIALATVQGKESVIIEDGIPYTVYSVKVDTPVYNSEKDQIFSIYMTGGETEEKIVEVIDDPLLKPNEKMLVFCKENPDGTYQILSGPQGRFIYTNGKLNSLNAADAKVRQANSFSDIEVEDADANSMIEKIKEYLKGEI